MQGNRKEREREFKKQEILLAAVQIFATKGYNNATLDEIAEASEFGKGTLYNYFQNKQEIYLAILHDVFTHFVTVVKTIDDESNSCKEFFTKLIKSMINYCVENPSEFLILAHSRLASSPDDSVVLKDTIIKMIEEEQLILMNVIKKGIDSGEVRIGDPGKLRDLIRGMVFGYVFSQLNCRGEREINVDEETEYILSVLFNGILAK